MMNVPSEALQTAFETLAESSFVRPAATADRIDGLSPQLIVEPTTSDELAGVLKYADESRLAVITRGGGTKLDWGNLPRRVDLVLSTKRLNRIVEHAWGDMTATVEAGCTIENFQNLLAEHRQRLALDPLWPQQATIGGILATNDSGALRATFGALRDLIIGITIALPNGTLAKSGGKVVKNVAGYDLPKLLTGSIGTLGIITEATFRLHPRPSLTRTTGYEFASADLMNSFVLAVQDSVLVTSGLQVSAQPGELLVHTCFEGASAKSIDAQVERLSALHQSVQAKLIDAPTEDVWSARERLWQGVEPSLVCKLGVLPTQLGEVVRVIERSTPDKWKLVAQGSGICLLRVEGASEESLITVINELRRELLKLDGSCVVLRCPTATKKEVDVWGASDKLKGALPLMRRIKEQFDPHETLNPGRFIGRI